jgi:hypothetical protein
MTAAVIVIVAVLCSGFSAVIANSKGRSVGGFAIAGLLLGVIGLIWAAFARPGGEPTRRQREVQEALDRGKLATDRDRRQRRSRVADMPQMRWPDDPDSSG